MKINISNKINLNSLEQNLPKILLGLFALVGVGIVIFVYLLFVEEPDKGTVASTQKELDSYNIKFNKTQIQNLFQSSPKPLEVKPDPSGSKNPFLHY